MGAKAGVPTGVGAKEALHTLLLAALMLGSPQDAPFRVGTAAAARGQVSRGAIEVPAGSDAALTIPVALVHGARPGPVLAIVAGSHGTEYASIIAVERLIQQIDPKALGGAVILVPLIRRLVVFVSFVSFVIGPWPVGGVRGSCGLSPNRGFYPSV